LQVSKIPPTFTYGNYSRIETDQICVITIRYPHFAPFSDMAMGYRISVELRVKKYFTVILKKSFLILRVWKCRYIKSPLSKQYDRFCFFRALSKSMVEET
jgi:hypothetical protein